MPIFVRYERHLARPATQSTISMAHSADVEEEAQLLPDHHLDTPVHRPLSVGAAAAIRDHSTNANQACAWGACGSTTHEATSLMGGREAVLPPDEFGPPKLDMSAPPPYSECDERGGSDVVLPMPTCQPTEHGASISEGEHVDVVQPPSYEEVQRIKAVEAQLETGDTILLPPHTGTIGDLVTNTNMDTCEAALGDTRSPEDDLLGTDFLFFLAFAAAFFFNWVGFVVLVCFCHSVAGRSGALAGFGLSLSKWAVIVRHSATLAPEANAWLLWLITVLGLVICMRAVLQYLNAKREWQNSSSTSRNRFLLFH